MQVHGQDVDVATVGHGHAPQQLIARVDVVEAFRLFSSSEGVSIGVAPRRVSNGIGAVTRSGPPEGALIEGHAYEGNVSVQRVQVGAERRLEEAPGMGPYDGPVPLRRFFTGRFLRHDFPLAA